MSGSRQNKSARPLDVAIVTSADFTCFNQDDRLLIAALEERGVRASGVEWVDGDFYWDRLRMAVIRSSWDYSDSHDEFLEWVRSTAVKTDLWNRHHTVVRNSNKSYLAELATRGIPVTETVWLNRGSSVELDALMTERGWETVIIKPVVSAGAKDTHRIPRADADRGGELLARLVEQKDMMVQPYYDAVELSGEISLMYIDGGFSHAIRKRPGGGDFRVQEDHGGTIETAKPTAAEMSVANRVFASITDETLYSRIDLIPDEEGRPLLVELELIEPELFLRFHPPSVGSLADAISKRLKPARS